MAAVKQKKQHTTCLKTSVKQTKKKKTSCDRGLYFRYRHARVVNKHMQAGMDFSAKWSNLAKGPSLKNLTDGGFGALKESQHAAVQDLTKAHIESFDQAVTDGLNRVVQVSSTSFEQS